MAEATTNQGSQRQNEEDDLSGGTQPLGASRHIGKDASSGGTADTTAPSGGVYPEPPSQAVPHTPIGRDQPGHAPKEHTPNEEGPGAKKV
jgi:hypothetical protein